MKITILGLFISCMFALQTQAAELTANSSNISTVFTGASDGDVILLDAGSYSYGFPIQASKTITIKKNPAAATIPVVTAQLIDPTGDNGGLIFDGVKFNRSSSMANGDYVMNLSSTMERPISTLQFKNCEMTGFGRSFIRTQGAALATATIGSIVIDNCMIHDIGNSYAFIVTNHIVSSLTVTNSTLYNYGGEKFFAPGNTTQANFTLNFLNNTVYKWSKASYNFFDVAAKFANTSVYNIKDNIFNLIYSGTKGTNYILNCTNGGTLNAANNLSVDFYGYNMTGTGATINNTDLALNTGVLAGITSIPFTDAANYNFEILSTSALATASSTGGIIGDPQWLKTVTNAVNLSTSVTPVGSGTTTPLSTTVNVGDNVTVTATKAFGYTFKEWRDAGTDAFVSTNNPYSFTIAANTSLVAVFDPVTTYNFTVNKEGTGATWGSVTLSPSPTNGKYETGTSVTMTPVSNLVSTFSQWENATTGARTVSITGDVSYSATFTANPFIAAWDFNPTEPRGNRYGDYYFSASNKGVMNFYAVDGNTTNWGGSTISAKTCARRYTAREDMSTNCRSFVVVFSAKGYKNIQVNSKITYDNNLVHTMQKLQYSIDGTNFIDLNAVDMSTLTKSSWTAFNGLLPATADNATNVYIRWIGIPGSYVGTVSSETSEGFYLTDVVISGSPVSSNASSGDYIATTSGDISTAANYSVSGGSFGISGTAASPPTTATNIIIPAGITMSNSSEVNCKDLNIKGALTASAPLTVTGNLTITSDADGTGTILDNGNLTVTGTTSVQQYLPDTRNWYVSSPVSKATSPGGFTYYRYDETGQNPSPVAPATAYWVSIAPGADLNKGVGYIALPSVAGSIIAFTAKTGETLNSGNVNITLTHSGATKTGFNLIGNPYPSHLTWTTAFVDDVTNAALIEPTIWVRTNAGDVNSGGNADWKFLTYNGHSGEASPLTTILTGGIIPPMQAFWVKAKAAGTLILDSKLTRSHQSSNLLKAPAAKKTDRQRIRLEISNGSITDETLLYFDGNASNMFDAYDSPKFSETKVVQIYTTVETEKLVMNGLNTMTDNMLIPLGIKTAQAGTFTLKPIQLDNIATDAKVYLMDGQLKTELELNKEYSFTSDASDNTSRFSLLFKTPLQTTQIGNIADKPVFNAYKNANGQLAVTVYEAINATSKLTVSNQLGQKLSERNLAETSTIVSEVLTAGVYFVTVSSNGKSSTQKVILN